MASLCQEDRLAHSIFGLATDGWISVEPTDVVRFEQAHKKNIREGEERLMIALLEEAVQCFQDHALSTRPREKRLFQQAEEWFLDEEADYISVEYICESLGLHPGQIRRGLMTWRDASERLRDFNRRPSTARS